MDFNLFCISRQTKPPNSEHEAFLVYIIEKNLTSKFYAIMLTHHTVVAIHFRGFFFKFQRVRFLFLWVCTFGGPLLKFLLKVLYLFLNPIQNLPYNIKLKFEIFSYFVCCFKCLLKCVLTTSYIQRSIGYAFLTISSSNLNLAFSTYVNFALHRIFKVMKCLVH